MRVRSLPTEEKGVKREQLAMQTLQRGQPIKVALVFYAVCAIPYQENESVCLAVSDEMSTFACW
jgi:hypothetical protein